MNPSEITAVVEGIVPAIREYVERHFAAAEKEMAALRDIVNAIPAGPAGEKGADGKDAVVDLKALEQVIREEMTRVEFNAPPGKDGENGKDGKDAEPVDRLTLAKDVLALIPVPRDGKDGIASLDEVKAIAAKAVDERIGAEVQKRVAEEFAALPALQYRGVFKENGEYKAGDCVTFGGSLWHCNAATATKPGGGSEAWTLAVKRGADGKDATR